MKEFYTVEEAAEEIGVSGSRIRQLVLANQIDHKYFGKMIMVTENGIEEAKARNKKRGRPFKETEPKAA